MIRLNGTKVKVDEIGLKFLNEMIRDLTKANTTIICPFWEHWIISPRTDKNDCQICQGLFPKKRKIVCPCHSDYTPLELIKVLNGIIRQS